MFYFVRSVQTDRDTMGEMVNGRYDKPVNWQGTETAKKLVNNTEIGDIKWAAVYVSPLSRAQKTADLVCDEPKTVDQRLVDRDYGEFTDCKLGDEFNYKFFWDSYKNLYGRISETLKDAEKRVHNFIGEITSKHPIGDILIVGHNSTVMFASSYFKGAPSDGNYLRYSVGCGEYVKFDKKG